MSAQLRIEYIDGGRTTEIVRPVGPEWVSFASFAGSSREALAEAIDAKAELLDAAHPKEDR